MNTEMMLEIFGYIGSTLVVVSMLMSSVVKLRVINAIGSVISGTYALICGAFPLVLMNACLIVINVYNLYKLLKTEQEYDLIEMDAKDASLLYFLNRYKQDICEYFPSFLDEVEWNRTFMVYCDGNPAGVLLGNESAGVLDVEIDYSIPTYRDCSVGKFLYSKLENKGIHTLETSQQKSEIHISYLEKMGFEKVGDKYVKKFIK